MAANNNIPLLSVLTSDQTQLREVDVDAPEWQEHQHLREKVKNMIMEAEHTTSQKLELINKIQRLGVCYQFQKEIESTLQHIFENYGKFNGEEDENNLYVVSVGFRLLRQEGYPVSSNVFEKFKNSEGKFKESLINNLQAILSLYEASHLRVHGEKILEEALTFTTSHLQSMLPNLSGLLRTEVSEALRQPFHRRLRRLEAKRYISIYKCDETHDTVLLKFAKLDFNMLQKEHQRELGILTRWDAIAVNELPEYMGVCYLALLDVYAEMEKELAKTGELYRVDYVKTEMKNLANAYLKEDKWFRDRYFPKFEEYMKLATETCGVRLSTITSLVGKQEDFVTKEVFDWLSKEPLIVGATSIICKLMDDMAGHEFEQQRGHMASSVECYMNQYVKSKEDTYNELQKQVIDAWKDTNQECLKPIVVPMPILTRLLNFSRVIDSLYVDGDSYTHSKTMLKGFITSLLVDHVL
nr:(-)-germacrene D synthase-like [Ipomoea batatas]